MLRIALFSSLFAIIFAAPVQLHSRYDLNSDSKVELGELETVVFADYAIPKKMAGKVMKEADLDGDGALSGEEIERARELVEEIGLKHADKWIESHDNNHDGFISSSEFILPSFMSISLPKSELEQIYANADDDKNGALEAKEVMGANRALRNRMLQTADEKLKQYDSNLDHHLSLTEAKLMSDLEYDVGTQKVERVFQDADLNADGEISSVEMAGLMELLRTEAVAEAIDKMKVIDSNSNGLVSYEEIKTKFGSSIDGRQLKKLFKRYDINKNILVEAPELVSMQAEFNQLNKDTASAAQSDMKVIKVHPKMSGEVQSVPRSKRETEEGEIEVVGLLPYNANEENVVAEFSMDDTDKIELESKDINGFQDFNTLVVKEDNDGKLEEVPKQDEQMVFAPQQPAKQPKDNQKDQKLKKVTKRTEEKEEKWKEPEEEKKMKTIPVVDGEEDTEDNSSERVKREVFGDATAPPPPVLTATAISAEKGRKISEEMLRQFGGIGGGRQPENTADVLVDEKW